MKRLVVLLTLLAVSVTAIGVYGREAPAPRVTPSPPRDADAAERRLAPLRSLCGTHAAAAVQTANVNLIQSDGQTGSGPEVGCATAQNEPTVAVNPNDPKNLVAGANDFRTCCDPNGDQTSTGWAYVSKDGGATWRDVPLPGLTSLSGGAGLYTKFDVAEDPAIAFGPDGTVYYAHIVFGENAPASGIAVSISHDGGDTWDPPRLVRYTNYTALFNDKEWIAVGDDGSIVITWSRFRSSGFGGDSVIQAAFSHDHGATWTKPIQVSGKGRRGAQGSIAVWGSGGTLYVVYEASVPPSPRRVLALATLAPGRGVTQRTLARVFDDHNCFATNANQRQTLSGEAFRVSAIPSATFDPSSQTLAVAWVDGERGCKQGRFKAPTDAQVKLVLVHESTVAGPRIITTGADKALAAVASRDGKVVVGYYTRSFAPSDCVYAAKRVCLDYAYSTSADDFATERRISDGSSNPFEQFAGMFIGDYAGLAIGADGVAHAVWTDSRGGDQNIYGQAFTP
jgi:hypothetical protein